MNKLTPTIRKLLLIASCIVVALALLLPGCNTWQLPQARSDARQKAALIADRRVELEELTVELATLQKDALVDPTPEKVAKVEQVKTVVAEKARETATMVRELTELTAAIKDSEAMVKETTAQAEGVAAYLPSPWRELAVLALGVGGTLIKARSTAKVTARASRQQAYEMAVEKVNQTKEEDGMILAAVVKSVDAVLTPELKAKIKQGESIKAAVQKAKGRV